MVQVEFGATVPLLSVTDLPPLAAATEAELPQPLNAGEAGFASSTFAGRSSVMEAWVKLAFGS